MSQVIKGDFTADKDSGTGNDNVQITVPQNDTAQRKTGSFVIKNHDGSKRITIVCTQMENGAEIINFISTACERILNSMNVRFTITPTYTLNAPIQLIFSTGLPGGTLQQVETIDILNPIQPGQATDFVIQNAISQQMDIDGWDWDCVFGDTGTHRSTDTYNREMAIMDSSGNYPDENNQIWG